METVSTGAGNDTVTFTANLADADVLDGGAGTDTLVGIDAEIAALTSTTTTSNVSNFEAITVSDDLDGNIDVLNVQRTVSILLLLEQLVVLHFLTASKQFGGELRLR